MSDTQAPVPTVTPAKAKKVNYIGAPAIFALELACQAVTAAFCERSSYGLFLVGSALERPDWRDVDVRLMMADDEFAALFPDAYMNGAWEFDPRWLLLTTAISRHLSAASGLPVDFQFQPQSWANEKHKKNRHPIGLKMHPKESP